MRFLDSISAITMAAISENRAIVHKASNNEQLQEFNS
jgi:hypothetical protein